MHLQRAAGFEDLRDQLRINNKLLITLLQRKNDSPPISQAQLIHAISSLGVPPTEVAVLLGTSPNTVRVALSRRRTRETQEREDAEDE